MKMKIVLLVLFFAAHLPAAGAETVDLSELDRSLDALVDYEYGQPGDVDLGWVEKQAAMSATDEKARAAVETMLLETLSAATTTDARQFLLRQLFAIATDRSVPQLRPMLTDESVSHLARLALSGIGSEASEDALLWGLQQTSGELQAGIINTLADMDCVKAKDRIMKLMRKRNNDVAIAAIKATGNFGGEDAVKALRRIRPRRSKERQLEVDASILRCAEQFRLGGQEEKATEIYLQFYRKTNPLHLRLAGLRGLLETEGEQGIERLAEAIRGNDADLRRNAVALMAGLEGPDITASLIGLAKTLPPEGQELIIRALASRRDTSAAPEVIQWTSSDDESVRLAAVEALGDIGTPQSIRPLAEAAASDRGRIRQVARESLVRLNGEGIDAQFVKELSKGDAASRQEILRAVGERELRDAFSALLEIANKEPLDDVRQEAILSLGKIGRNEDLDAFLKLLLSPFKTDDLSVVRKAMVTLFRLIEDKEALSAHLISIMKGASEQAQAELLSLLSKPATATALTTVVSQLDSPSEAIRDAAIRSLTEWPNAAPLQTLYEIAASREDELHSALAFRAYVRLAALTEDPTNAYLESLKMANNHEEIKLALGGLGQTSTLTALETAESYIENEKVRDEATLAAVRIASKVCWFYPDQAKSLLERALKETKSFRIRDEALKAVQKMKQWKHYLFAWIGSGPYMIDDVHDGGTVFQTPFKPETDPTSQEIHWIPVRCELDGDRIDLHETFGDLDYCSAYLVTTILSPEAREAKLNWSADDLIKGWLNGEPISAGEITLNKGPNRLMIKVGDHAGGWLFNCRLTQLDDTPLKDFKLVVE